MVERLKRLKPSKRYILINTNKYITIQKNENSLF